MNHILSKINLRYSLIITLLVVLGCSKGFGQDAKAGETLFKANCTSCHNVHKKLVGPALKGVHDRWDGKEDEIISFVTNTQKYMKAGRPKSDYAQKLFKDFNEAQMNIFENLKPEEIKSILAYIKTAPEPAGTKVINGGTDKGEEKPTNGSVIFGLVSLLGTLIFACVALIFIVAIVANAIKMKEAEGRNAVRPFVFANVVEDFKDMMTNRFVHIMLLVVIGGGVGTGAVKQARSVGVKQDYAPLQPIAFSHKIHAGQFKISCNYCHVGVEKGRGAIIPSTNICMNCHQHVQEGTNTGTKEIAKIHASYKENKPIEWVRVHNLPDLVYFAHAQHVKVAGLTCQTCHGPVEEMDVVYQYNPLTMAWCINCHREKTVDINKNEYYIQTHGKKHGKEEHLTVENLGGIECAKCHY